MNSEKARPKVRYPRFWAGLGLVAVLLLVTFGVWYFFHQAKNHHPQPAPHPFVGKENLQPSSYGQTRRLFGPWHLAPSGNTGAPHLVMLRSAGGTDVSSKVVHVKGSWSPAEAEHISSVNSDRRHIRIESQEGNVYHLKYGQAFIWSQNPESVYGFVHDGLEGAEAKLVYKFVSAFKKR